MINYSENDFPVVPISAQIQPTPARPRCHRWYYRSQRPTTTIPHPQTGQPLLVIALTECGNKNDTYETWWTKDDPKTLFVRDLVEL